MFSISKSSVLAANASKENMYNDIVNSAKSNAKNYDKVKFKCTYFNFNARKEKSVVQRVVSIVVTDFKKNEAKIKSIVYYKDDNNKLVKIKVLCKRDLELEDYKYKFSKNVKKYSRLQERIKGLFDSKMFFKLSTSVCSNSEDLISKYFYAEASSDDFHDVYDGIAVRCQYKSVYPWEDTKYTVDNYVDRHDFRKSTSSIKYNEANYEVTCSNFEFIS
jgi:hypothetical protein